MAKWTAAVQGWTPIAVADATNFTNAGYMALQGGSGSQELHLLEVMLGGLAAAHSPAQMIVGRDSTIGATSLTGAINAAHDPATAALGAPPAAFNSSTTKPQRSATLQLLMLPFNAYGGITKWAAPDDEGLTLLGNTASFGELSLSHASAGTPGLMGSHFIYEPK